jgi:hypothetical protein
MKNTRRGRDPLAAHELGAQITSDADDRCEVTGPTVQLVERISVAIIHVVNNLDTKQFMKSYKGEFLHIQIKILLKIK